MNIPLIRLLNQQIISPQTESPVDVVRWMGAVQAQDMRAAEWAVGLRTRSCTRADVERAIEQGRIIRIHVMRPTWHFVTPDDVGWILRLTRESNERAYGSYLRGTGVNLTDRDYEESADVLRLALEGGRELTIEELSEFFARKGMPVNKFYMDAYLWRGESRAVVCSGRMSGGKNTYRLLDELTGDRPCDTIDKEDALERLATMYFHSHSPATIQDFVWWSGLKVVEAKLAVNLIKGNMSEIELNGRTVYVHDGCRTHGRCSGTVTLLPPYDEYMLGYKDRTDVLPIELQGKAFNTHGIFYRIVHQGGQIVGNWNERRTSKGVGVSVDYFRDDVQPNDIAINKTVARFNKFS